MHFNLFQTIHLKAEETMHLKWTSQNTHKFASFSLG